MYIIADVPNKLQGVIVLKYFDKKHNKLTGTSNSLIKTVNYPLTNKMLHKLTYWWNLETGKYQQIHTHPFNGPFSGNTQVSRYQKGKTNLVFTEARDSEWQRHQLGRMQVCTLLQTDNHASTPPLLSFYRLDALPAAQPIASKHWRQKISADSV